MESETVPVEGKLGQLDLEIKAKQEAELKLQRIDILDGGACDARKEGITTVVVINDLGGNNYSAKRVR